MTNLFVEARKAHRTAQAKALREAEEARRRAIRKSGAELVARLQECLGLEVSADELTVQEARCIYAPREEPIIFWIHKGQPPLKLLIGVNYPPDLYDEEGRFLGSTEIKTCAIDTLKDLGRFLVEVDKAGDALFKKA